MSTIKRKQVTKEAINKWRQNHGKWPLEARVTKEELDLGVKPLGSQFIHSCYVRTTMDGGDALTISELTHFSDDTARPSLRLIKKPKRTFYMAKPETRNYDEKREIEHVQNLDKFVVENSELGNAIYKQLNNGRDPTGFVRFNELLDSPYVYGADVGIETLCKHAYQQNMQKRGLTPKSFTTGFLDIEKRIGYGDNQDAEITLITYTHMNKVYTAILDNAFYKRTEDGKYVKGDIKELEAYSRSVLDPITDDILKKNKTVAEAAKGFLPFQFHYYVGKKEIDLIRWIFFHIHRNKTSFVGIWNMNYDLPEIMKVIKKEGLNPEDIFAYPGIHPGYRYAHYQFDDKKVANPVDKWHWMHSTSFTQFTDSMAIYAKLRTVIGKEPNYKLDTILAKNNVTGKLFKDIEETKGLSSTEWHRYMTKNRFYDYIIYNQFDSLSMVFMELQNGDHNSMVLLSGVTPVSKYPRQTRKVADTLYTDWLDQGYVLGCAGSNMRGPYDSEMIAQGGAVLSPTRVDQAGLFAIDEFPRFRTQLHPFVNDVDFTGMYPNCCQASNVSKETKLSTVLYITGESVQHKYTPQQAVEVYFSYMTSPIENGMRIGKEIFGLPGFDELDAGFGQFLMDEEHEDPEKVAA